MQDACAQSVCPSVLVQTVHESLYSLNAESYAAGCSGDISGCSDVVTQLCCKQRRCKLFVSSCTGSGYSLLLRDRLVMLLGAVSWPAVWVLAVYKSQHRVLHCRMQW